MGFEVTLCDNCNHAFSSDLLPNPNETTQLVDLIRSNCVPPERSHLRSVLSSAPAELARFDQEIGRLQTILERTQIARAVLQSHYDGCRSVFSLLHRMPSEILCKIFACVPPLEPHAAVKSRSQNFKEGMDEEFESVAQVHLLRLASVCSRWHTLVMGTPVLWSKVTVHNYYWSEHRRELLDLLQLVLNRGVNSPLTVHAVHQTFRAEPMKLLAQYSRRWRHFSLETTQNLAWLSTVKGQLPILETLTIHGGTVGRKDLEPFQDAPLLTRLNYNGSINALSTFPLKQLHHLSYLAVDATELGHALSLMNNLSDTATFLLQAYTTEVDLPLGLTPVAATLRAFVIILGDNLDRAGKILGEIFDNLTMQVQKLSILGCRLVWPHPQSLAFLSRSSLSRSLKVLEIPYAVITEATLAECLGELPALEHLAVSDHNTWGVTNHLITNSLFQRLTWTSDPSCLVPRLNFLSCRTRLIFSDAVFLLFVLSRVAPGRNSSGPFKTTLLWYDGYERDLDVGVQQQLQELKLRKEYVFDLRECSDDRKLKVEDAEQSG
ncbi:hypothetical protein C8J57DRAFT_1714664 [Mycena rebaudengoi]|nr:hypothetical protein C8J57DRAFT_1714664 [Mycena rebaudengoi]